MLSTYSLSFEKINWTQLDTYLLPFVSEERRNRIMSYYFDIDKKLSLYAALLTRMEICNWTGMQVTELVFGRNNLKKPILISSPKINFNFAHTRNFVLLGISDSVEIGVDVEKIKDAPFEIADTVFHPKEKEYIFDAPLEEQKSLFFQIWTRKEAFIKQSGEGLSCNLAGLNMLEPSLSSFFYSWESNNYICSVYAPTQTTLNHEIINLRDIQKYYEIITRNTSFGLF